MWNVRERTLEGIPRTNNKLEGWHRRLQTQMDNPHPSIRRVFKALQREQGIQFPTQTALMAGQQNHPPAKKFMEINKRLQTLITQFDSGDKDRSDFIRSVLHNLSLNV